MFSAASKFDTLPARPPTPPRELSKAIDDAIDFLDDCNEVERATAGVRPSSHTVQPAQEDAPASPASSRGTISTSNATKSVDFSPHPVYHRASHSGELSSSDVRSPKKQPSTKGAKPLRSILKLANPAPPPTPEDIDSRLTSFSPEIPGSFSKMLQSVVQQLAGQSMAGRLDAYLALNGVLKTYEGVPDTEAMDQKMGLLMQFISRDMAWKNSDGVLDINIVMQALKLANAILSDSKLVEAVDDDFKTALVDRSIFVAEQPEMPKAVVKAHLSVLGQHRFQPSIMTKEKATKLMVLLKTIEDRCSGNNVILTRLVIYLRFLGQTPGVMLANVNEWLEHVFHGMLSSIKDVRVRAIEVCTQAGFILGSQPHASKALNELFETPVEEGQTYCDYLSLRLIQMMADKEIGPCVPQIWSAVILFFRNKRRPLELWPKFKSWVKIIQKCFNSSDTAIRYQAALAWNKLVFAIMPGSSLTKNMMSMLLIPISNGFEKRGADKFSQQIRQYTLDSYCNLLHYALRPGLTYEEQDAAWDMYVDPVLSYLARFNGRGRYTTCAVLYGLAKGNTGVWNINAALDATPIKPENLPRLDPRWVRSRLQKILKSLEPVLANSMWSSPEANKALDETWRSIIHSVADAGSQEVKTSTDLKEAISALVNLFHRLWAGVSPDSEAIESRWLDRYVSLIDLMVSGLGARPFTEEILARTKDDAIEVAPTPSHRHSKHYGPSQSPLIILFGQFYRPPNALKINEAFGCAASTLLKALTCAKTVPTPRLELLAQVLMVCSPGPDTTSDLSANEQLWIAIARNATDILTQEPSVSSEQESQSLGHGFRSALDILLGGLDMTTNDEIFTRMQGLYDAIHNSAKASAGDAGVVLALVEPFSKELVDSASSVPLIKRLNITCHVLEKATWPKSHQSMDQGRKALWGVGFAPHKSLVFQPFDHFYHLTEESMLDAYNHFDALEVDLAQRFFALSVRFLDKGPLSVLVSALRHVQGGIAVWIEDHERKTSDISLMVRNFWSSVLRLLEKLPSKDSALLKVLETLLSAGLSSPHKAVVNETLLFWNETFGKEQSLEYPAKLERLLRACAVEADVTLPTFPESSEEVILATLPAFFDSQNDLPMEQTFPKLPDGLTRSPNHLRASEPPVRSAFASANRSPNIAISNFSSPAKRPSRRSESSTPNPRIRHNDSQIEFEPINSSPIPREDESQLLTEHQKEVKARQLNDAQLFPELSSSPMAKSTALPMAVSKRLDFTSNTGQQRENEAPGTPAGLPDGNGLMSDELPSSPTPSSNKDAIQGALHVEDDQELEDVPQDPPSSPPRATGYEDQADAEKQSQYAIGPDESTVGVLDFAMLNNQLPPESKEKQELHEAKDGERDEEPEIVEGDHFPSDSELPTIQLQIEEAAGAEKPGFDPTYSEGAVSISRPSKLGGPSPSEDAQPDEEAIAKSELEVRDPNEADEPEEDLTRVEDSFTNPEAVVTETNSPNSQRSSKKRKRRSPVVYVPKKRKQQSPLKRLPTIMWGQNQPEEEDDNSGDEIMVASSQRSSSPDASSPTNHTNTSELIEEPVQATKDVEEQEIVPLPRKRGRGRPRRSETPHLGQPEPAPARSLKRKASTLSNMSAPESQSSTSFAKDTPSPRSDKKSRVGRDRTLVLETHVFARGARRHPGLGTEGSAVATHSAKHTEVGAQSNAEAAVEVVQSNDKDIVAATPDQQLVEEQAAASFERPIATPRSILARLRSALTDFRGMILGTPEEREFDDVLFELRRETHEAGRRGREQ